MKMRVANRLVVMGVGTLMLAACGGEDTPSAAGEEGANSSNAAEDNAANEAKNADEKGGVPTAFSQCSACHSVQPGVNGLGPSLAGIYGQKAAMNEDFAYSGALREADLTWDDATLNAFLENPRSSVPGTKMSYAGMRDAEKREEIVKYIKGL